MAQYKVPQDVEADDKLLGPFNARQFLYLVAAVVLIAAAVGLGRILLPLCIIPIPFVGFFLILALPLKKDQPMETYLSAVVSYHLKPHNRFWEAGEPETTIIITAPKQTDEIHLKNISQEEATHRLSFLAEIVDTEGYAIKEGQTTTGVRAEVYAEANAVQDIFDTPNYTFSQALPQATVDRHDVLVNQMREAIAKNNKESHNNNAIIGHNNNTPDALPQMDFSTPAPAPQPTYDETDFEAQTDFSYNPSAPNIAISEPVSPVESVTPLPQPYYNSTPQAPNLPAPQFVENAMEQPYAAPNPQMQNPQSQTQPQPIAPANPFEANYPNATFDQNSVSQDIVNLANNQDFSVETIAQQANRINNQPDNEVFVTLH